MYKSRRKLYVNTHAVIFKILQVKVSRMYRRNIKCFQWHNQLAHTQYVQKDSTYREMEF